MSKLSTSVAAHRRSAMTLIEVIAALMLLGATITSILVAQGRAVHNVHEAGRQLTAQQLASELIAEWQIDGTGVSVDDHDVVDGFEEWSWHRTSRTHEATNGVSFTQVTLSLAFRKPNPGHEPWVREFRWLINDGTP